MLIDNRKYKNTILATAIFTLLLLLFEIIPNYTGLVASVVTVLEQNSEIERIAENESEIEELTRQINMLESSVYNNVTAINKSRNLSSVISNLDSLSGKSKIKNLAFKPGEVKKENNLLIQPIEINLKSEYESIYNFIRFLENSARVIKIKELSLKPVKPFAKSLTLTAKIEVYLNL